MRCLRSQRPTREGMRMCDVITPAVDGIPQRTAVRVINTRDGLDRFVPCIGEI